MQKHTGTLIYPISAYMDSKIKAILSKQRWSLVIRYEVTILCRFVPKHNMVNITISFILWIFWDPSDVNYVQTLLQPVKCGIILYQICALQCFTEKNSIAKTKKSLTNFPVFIATPSFCPGSLASLLIASNSPEWSFVKGDGSGTFQQQSTLCQWTPAVINSLSVACDTGCCGSTRTFSVRVQPPRPCFCFII